MLTYEPADRITPLDALQHFFFNPTLPTSTLGLSNPSPATNLSFVGTGVSHPSSPTGVPMDTTDPVTPRLGQDSMQDSDPADDNMDTH